MRFSVPKAVFAAVFVAVIGYAAFTLRGPGGIPGLLEKQQRIEALEKRNAALAKEVERKHNYLQRLRHNSEAQDLEIRRRWKYVPPGETVFILRDSGKPR
jgi:cell division protein FtsB